MGKQVKIGITHGDINGISYEIIINTLSDNRIMEFCTPVIYGSAKVGAYHRKALNIKNFNFNNIKNPDDAHPKRANLINCVDDNVRVELGKSTGIAGSASYQSLQRAMEDLQANKFDALVTAPIDKHSIQSNDFEFPGHTEFLQSKFGADEVLMLMVNEVMKIGVVTGHVPLSKVPSLITEEAILSKLRVLNKSLLEDFAVRKPRIAVLGLNPHSSDNGLIGNEEKDVIVPAINKAREMEILAFGPFPTDGFFGSENYTKFDAILAMYHDQGLTPFKALSYDGGVNFTAGLPVVRTSPAHGTAFELAGKGQASDSSFKKAIYLAIDIFRNREQYKEINSDPLKSIDLSEFEK